MSARGLQGVSGDPPDDTSNYEAREALCRRCGVSCHVAIPVNGLPVVVEQLRCRYLRRDPDGRYGCEVYARRYAVAPWCFSAEQALTKGLLAQDCPYARGVPGYRGKVRLSLPLLNQVLPAVRAEVARAGLPYGADPDAALGLLEQGGGRWRYELDPDTNRYRFERLPDPASPPEVLDPADLAAT